MQTYLCSADRRSEVCEECVGTAGICLVEAFSLDDDAYRFNEHTHLGPSGVMREYWETLARPIC